MTAVCFVLLLHLMFASASFTCSGSSMLHCLVSSKSLWVMVSIVDSFLPSFFKCHEYDSIFGMFSLGLVLFLSPAKLQQA